MLQKKYKGIKKASSETINWPVSSGGYTEIFYNARTDEVWTVDQVSFGQNSWKEHNDPAVVKVCNTSHHMTMKQIKAAIDMVMST